MNDKLDGWYLPYSKNKSAFILECKAENIDIQTAKCVDEIKKNCRIVLDAGYANCFGLLTNGNKCLGFMNNEPVTIPAAVQSLDFYLSKFTEKGIKKKAES